MALPYWDLTDLQDRIGAEVVRNYIDDDNDGSADAGPLARLQADCDSYVEGYLRGIYDLDAVRATPPNQVKRLSLDRAEVTLARRHPEYARRDWAELNEVLDRELCAIRSGKIRLDVVASPEPGANQGGALLQPGASTSGGLVVTSTVIFGAPCGMGDF